MAEDADHEPEIEPTFIDPARRSERGQLRDALPPESRAGGPPPADSDSHLQGPRPSGLGPASGDSLPMGIPIESTLRAVEEPDSDEREVRRIGPYELRRILGKGGMGVVYEVFDPEQRVTCALKVISSADVDREELARFDREARAVKKLAHPNIVAIHDVGLDSGRPYFTMEMVEGTTLQALARGSAPLTARRSAELLTTVASAIHYAHEQGIIHRDLKPANILIDEDGEPHITDFGLAKDLGEATMGNLTLTGVAMGSPPYMPPEQARGLFRQVDAVSDVYGLGAVLYECLTGRPPFRGKSLYDVIAQVLTQEPRPPSKIREDVPAALETICLKALEKEKWRRYPSAQAMGRDLQRFLRGEPVRAVRGGLTTRIGRRVAQHRHVVAGLLPFFVIAALLTYAFGPKRYVVPPGRPDADARAQPGTLLAASYGVSRGTGYRPLVEALEPLPGRDWERVFPRREELDHATWVQLSAELPEAGSAFQPRLLNEILDLLAGDRSLEPARASRLLEELLQDSQPELLHPLQQAFLASLGRARPSPEAFQLALERARTYPSPLDRAVYECARDVLDDASALAASLPRSLASSVESFRAPVLRPGGYVQARPTGPGAQPWRWPPAAQRELCQAWGSATHPLLSQDGRWVYVGWLRFVYTLSSADGRVRARTRLPGVARQLRHHSGGGFEVETATGELRRWSMLRPDSGPGLALDPPFAPSLTPEPTRVPVDELRWLARARFPACDPGVEVQPRAARGPWRFYPYLPVDGGPARCGVADIGFEGPQGPRLVLGDGIVVAPDSWARRQLSSEERLERILPQLEGVRPTLLLHLSGRELPLPLKPTFRPVDPQDPALAPLLDDAALLDEDNPWVLGFAAALRHELGAGAPPVGSLLERALESPLLLGTERLSLRAYLEAHGLGVDALGLETALSDLDGAGWVAGWSATGPLDPWSAAGSDVARAELASLGKREAAAPGGLGARGVVVADGVHQFQQSLLPGAVGLLLMLWLRYRRQARRDLERCGVRGRRARWRLWWANPRVRLSFAWPTYVTPHDKAAVVMTLFLYFVLVGLNDAARESLTAARRGPQTLCGGYPTAPASCAALDLAFRSYRRSESTRLSIGATASHTGAFEAMRVGVPTSASGVAQRCGWGFAATERTLDQLVQLGALELEEQPSPGLAYARAWAKQRARLPDEEVRAAYRDALALERSAPALLGLAQQLAGDPEAARALIEEAREADPALVDASLTPPLPDRGAREEALLGRERWWTAWPARTLRALFVPVPGRIDASLLAFERAWDRPLEEQRARNTMFWMVPFALLLMLGSLLIPSPRYFEPVQIDARPSLLVGALGPFVPGAAQVMTGRPLRGSLYAFVWMFAVSELLHVSHPWGLSLLGLGLSELSEATGDGPGPLLEAIWQWKLALSVVLVLLYGLHLVDLRALRHRLKVAFEEDVESRVASVWEIPLDSTLASVEPGKPVEREEPGPFDDSLGVGP